MFSGSVMYLGCVFSALFITIELREEFQMVLTIT